MKIIFILPDVNSFHKLEIHFGIAYIAGYLKANGYKDIRVATVTSVEDYNRVVQEITDYNPDIVGFTSVETQFNNVKILSKLIKEKHKCLIVCGGAFPTIFPDCIKDAEYVDALIRGESEDAFLKFVRVVEKKEDYHNVENVCYYNTKEERVVINPLLPLENKLDRFGFPDRGIFNFQSIIEFDGGAPFMFNRGCPYNCSFCSNHALASVYGSKINITRKRSVESCLSEIRDVNAQYRFDVVHIWDDLFTSDRKWLYEFLDKYKTNVRKPFMCTTRSNLCNDEMFKKLKDAGCYRVHMSLESGNDFIRNRVLKRNISRDAIVKSFGLAKKYGIEINASSIIGSPFETEAMIRETIDLLGILRVESPGVNVFYPYKGTRLREVCEEYGMVDLDVKYDIQERRESMLDLPHISKSRLNYYQQNFEALVRRKQGVLPYLKHLARPFAAKVAKFVLPQNIHKVIRRMRQSRRKKAFTSVFPMYPDI